MSILPAILALVLVASPKGAKPPLDGCDATPIENGWQYDCPDVRARLEDRAESGDAVVKYVAGMVQAAPAVVGKGAQTRSEKRTLRGAPTEVIVTEAPGQPAAVFLAPLGFEKGTRVLMCYGENLRCAGVLGALSIAAWRGGPAAGTLRKKPAPLAIAGRAVKAPAGCESTTQPRGGRVVCSKTDWVGWVAMEEEQARRMRTDFGGNMRKVLDQPGWTNAQSEVPCRLAGAETTCARIDAKSSSGALVVVWAVAPAGEDWVFANCMMKGSKPGSPCSLVLELR